MKRILCKWIGSLFFVYTIVNPLHAVPKFSYSFLNSAVQEFESENSTSSVLILETETGKIMYAYRPEIGVSKILPPGSLVKTFSALVLLKYKEQFGFVPEKKVRCSGKFYPDGILTPTKVDLSSLHLPKDEKGKEYLRCSLANGHGEMDLNSALIQSCNVYFLSTAALNPDFFYSKLLEDWNLIDSTRARMQPYLEPGTVLSSPSPLRKVAAAIGEGGLLLSPLKISQLYASIWSGGPILSPYWDEDKKPLQIRDNRFSDRDLRRITNALSNVPKSGTLKGLKNVSDSDFEILGAKTGTGTKFGHKYETHGWTVLHFKQKAKSYVLTVFVEKGSGGKQARSLAVKILDKLKEDKSSSYKNSLGRKK